MQTVRTTTPLLNPSQGVKPTTCTGLVTPSDPASTQLASPRMAGNRCLAHCWVGDIQREQGERCLVACWQDGHRPCRATVALGMVQMQKHSASKPRTITAVAANHG